jgi:hypothetical protein
MAYAMVVASDRYDDFYFAWNTFSDQFQMLGEHREVSHLGERVWREQLRVSARKQFVGMANSGAVALAVSPELKVPVTADNVDELARSHAELRTSLLPQIRESLVLVLGHTIFETFAIEVCRILLDSIDEQTILSEYGKRKVTLAEVCEPDLDPIKKAREIAIHSARFEKTLPQRIELITRFCAKSNSRLCQELCSIYAIREGQLSEVDERRQRIVHSANLDPTYDATSDLEFLIKAGRWLGHTVSNCYFSKAHKYFGVSRISDFGEFRLDDELPAEYILVNESDILASMPRGAQNPSDG